ncbi:MAG: ATP-binding cassette domain-containing protein [Bacteroidetes bacterium]|nr:ATP-binding cassette domain-containing protein [Bacteroidota bacterium]MBL6943755.1 ATP-binding cassette domain-containing protein [Bacteroidales bacterium]
MESQPIITLSNLEVFQKNKLVLTNVNLDISQGEFIYMIGKTGSGKSSLMQILYADLPVEKGEALVCGFELKSIRRKKLPHLRRKLGIVFQDFQLLDDRNVKKNLEFVLKATGWRDKQQIENRILHVLDEVELIDKLNVMPHQLSGGEQQRIAIARALLNEPDVVLADEPTGNLDPETSNGIMKILFRISELGKTVIMATHNYNLIHKFPGRVIKCEEGTLK